MDRGRLADPCHNAVVRLAADGQRGAARIDEWCAALCTHAVPGVWHVSPSVALPACRAAWRWAAADGGEEPAMTAGLPPGPLEQRGPAGLWVRRLAAADGPGACRRGLGQSLGEGVREADWAATAFARRGFGPNTLWRRFVGLRYGEESATATRFVHAGTAGVCFPSTLPSARRPGVGAR